jgi:hypothetical protein
MLPRLGRLIASIGIAAFGYFFIYRPIQLRWGATAEEVRREMPGDGVQPRPVFNATRVITIQAQPQQIWPWLVQMGYRRAGWYGYDWIDNDGIASSTQVLPEWQGLKVGDTIPIWKNLDFPVTALEPNRTLVFVSNTGKDSMALGLYPVNARETRLVWRIRLGPYDGKSRWIAAQIFTDCADFIAVRQNLLGIKRRAEGRRPESGWSMYSQLGIWVGMFFLFVAAGIASIVRRNKWLLPTLPAAAGLITVWAVLMKPPLWADVLGLALCGAFAWRAFSCRTQETQEGSRPEQPAGDL